MEHDRQRLLQRKLFEDQMRTLAHKQAQERQRTSNHPGRRECWQFPSSLYYCPHNPTSRWRRGLSACNGRHAPFCRCGEGGETQISHVCASFFGLRGSSTHGLVWWCCAAVVQSSDALPFHWFCKNLCLRVEGRREAARTTISPTTCEAFL